MVMQKLVVVFTAIVISQFQLNLSELSVFIPHAIVGISPKKIGGGTINTEIDMRGNLYINLSTDTPTAFITKVIIKGSNEEEMVLEGCMLQKCSYNIEHLPPSVFYVMAITDTGGSFSGYFQRM